MKSPASFCLLGPALSRMVFRLFIALGFLLASQSSPGFPYLYATSWGDSTRILVIDVSSDTIVASIPDLFQANSSLSPTQDGQYIYVISRGVPGVRVLETATRKFVAPISDPRLDSPSCVTMSPDGTRAYVTNGDKVYVLSTRTRTVVTAIPNVFGTCFFITPDGKQAVTKDYVPSLVDLRTLKASPLPLEADILALAPDGKRLYGLEYGEETSFAYQIVAVDLRTLTRSHFGELASDYDVWPASMTFTPDGKRLLVGTFSSCTESWVDTWFQVVDMSNASIALSSGPMMCVGGSNATMSPDGSKAYLDQIYNGVQVVDMSTLGVGFIGPEEDISDFIVSPLGLRCSSDRIVDGRDRTCSGGLFKSHLWAYLWPTENISQVDFYLDGKFRRTEHLPPWELDGGSASWLAVGPHELRAVVQFKDGSKRMTLTSNFDVGKPPLRCSTDRILDGNDPACDGRSFDKPIWIYWWPQTGVKSVDFYLDGEFHRTENYAPYELEGGAVSSLAPGPHDVRAVLKFRDGRSQLTESTTVIRR